VRSCHGLLIPGRGGRLICGAAIVMATTTAHAPVNRRPLTMAWLNDPSRAR